MAHDPMDFRDEPRGHQALRMGWHLAATIALLAVAIHIRPDQFGITVYHFSRLTAGAWFGYVIDTHAFKSFLPRLSMRLLVDVPSQVLAMRVAARAGLIAASMIAIGMTG